eukprot:TRINITY_DN5602_c0_g3_i1.p2 TRINITY_DN5602_c0_g3~~TRINITY_DN5602_c0_g3_i1.p2  ORF type:complete len:197 (-),score=-15.29 TRINITY_DN5602_c0_g3_i1:825-1415(-)
MSIKNLTVLKFNIFNNIQNQVILKFNNLFYLTIRALDQTQGYLYFLLKQNYHTRNFENIYQIIVTVTGVQTFFFNNRRQMASAAIMTFRYFIKDIILIIYHQLHFQFRGQVVIFFFISYNIFQYHIILSNLLLTYTLQQLKCQQNGFEQREETYLDILNRLSLRKRILLYLLPSNWILCYILFAKINIPIICLIVL